MHDKALIDTLFAAYQAFQPVWNTFASFVGIFGQFLSVGLDTLTFFLGFIH